MSTELDDKPLKNSTSFTASHSTDTSARFDASTTSHDKRDYSSTNRHRTFTSYGNTSSINNNKFNPKLNKSFGHEPSKSSHHHHPPPPFKSFNQQFNNSHSKFATSMNQPMPVGGQAGLVAPAPLLNTLPGLYPSYPKPLLDNFMPAGSPNSFPRQSVNLSQPDPFSSSSSRGFNFSQSQSRLHAQRYNNPTSGGGGKRPPTSSSTNNTMSGTNYHNQFRFAPSYPHQDKDEGEIV